MYNRDYFQSLQKRVHPKLPSNYKKRCGQCCQFKQADQFNKRSLSPDGLANSCRSCNRSNSMAHAEKMKQIKMGLPEDYMKQCSICKKHLHKSKFWSHPIAKDKLTSACIECLTPKIKEYANSPKGRIVHNKSTLAAEQKYPERRNARSAVRRAIQRGQLPHPTSLVCFFCKNPANEYHHWSYKKEHQLQVIPVDQLCHTKVENPQRYTEATDMIASVVLHFKNTTL